MACARNPNSTRPSTADRMAYRRSDRVRAVIDEKTREFSRPEAYDEHAHGRLDVFRVHRQRLHDPRGERAIIRGRAAARGDSSGGGSTHAGAGGRDSAARPPCPIGGRRARRPCSTLGAAYTARRRAQSHDRSVTDPAQLAHGASRSDSTRSPNETDRTSARPQALRGYDSGASRRGRPRLEAPRALNQRREGAVARARSWAKASKDRAFLRSLRRPGPARCADRSADRDRTKPRLESCSCADRP